MHVSAKVFASELLIFLPCPAFQTQKSSVPTLNGQSSWDFSSPPIISYILRTYMLLMMDQAAHVHVMIPTGQIFDALE